MTLLKPLERKGQAQKQTKAGKEEAGAMVAVEEVDIVEEAVTLASMEQADNRRMGWQCDGTSHTS